MGNYFLKNETKIQITETKKIILIMNVHSDLIMHFIILKIYVCFVEIMIRILNIFKINRIFSSTAIFYVDISEKLSGVRLRN